MKTITKMSISVVDKFFFGWWVVQEIPAQCDCHEGPKPQGDSLWHFSVTSEDVLKQSLSPNHHSWHKTKPRTSLLQRLPKMKWDFVAKHQSQQLIASWSLSDSPAVLLSAPFWSRCFMDDIRAGQGEIIAVFPTFPWAQGWVTVRTDPQSAHQCWKFTTSWTTGTRKSGLKSRSGTAVVLILQRVEKEPCTNREI